MRIASSRHSKGFTLIELVVVIAIVGIIAALTVPNLLASRGAANETSAISALRQISTSQLLFSNKVFVDADTDGRGEYGFFGELSGSVMGRLQGAALVDPPLVSGAFRLVNPGGIAMRSGFAFCLYLPDQAGQGLIESPANYPLVDPDLAEIVWCVYAWPREYKKTGSSAYFMNQSGEIMRTDNSVNHYSGLAAFPPADAAFTAAGNITGSYQTGQVAVDGGIWRVIN